MTRETKNEELVNFAEFEPAITVAELSEMERASSSDSRGIQRRMALMVCARSSGELSQLNIDNPKAFEEMLDHIEAFKDHAQALAEIAETACQRLAIVGRRQKPAIQ
ncbi:MAG: hypothetical protein M8364_15975 [Methylobacter sp.]|uniref:hypothetical protein n=1 Tax=Methylobacter sp. TaxID=2051955 RepID=UPI00258352C5|nr:hypothetical protein [Methylobacter sp.]MCL7422390.1 hypothetical protein [Methylobacter sp.]